MMRRLFNAIERSQTMTLSELIGLALLLEKDFVCLDRSDEDNQDTLANSNAGIKC